MDTYVIERFLTAQDNPPEGCCSYEQALSEIKSGRKTGHWMWYVFPQIQGLGHSGLSKKFGIDSVNEAKAYYNHPVLRARMNEILTVILNLPMIKHLQQKLISMRYFKGATQSIVADKLGISQVQVSRMEKKILENMRNNMQI